MKTIPGLLAVLALAACGHAPTPPVPAATAEVPPARQPCPDGVPDTTTCLGGQDRAGAFYLMALPKDWNGHLVLHAHGGPFLGAPTAQRVREDLSRWSVMPRAGYAWAASSFRQGGVAVRAAAEDTERLRQLFVAHVGQPTVTVLHGQSWGAGVAATAAAQYTAGRPYDAVLLTSGVLAGGTRAYDMRLDLRVVYQYLCRNHPRADEPPYPLWQGLPASSPLKTADVAARADECLGVGTPAARRTPEQAARLKVITDVFRLPERAVLPHLQWATFHFQDIARRHGGAALGNIGARYQGSDQDDALNAGVLRYAADPRAVAAFAADADPTGHIPVPVLTVHGIRDTIAFVEMEHTFAATMARAGRAGNLVQTFVDESEHSYLSDATYVGLLDSLERWRAAGEKPTPADVAARCEAARARFPSACRFQPGYVPAPLDSRVPARERP